MATIKSYSDIEQSKKLAEILPLESADMYYNLGESNIPNFIHGSHSDFKCYTMCWSITALLGVLSYPSLHKTFTGWRCDSYDKEGNIYKLGENADNPVDACVAVILELYN